MILEISSLPRLRQAGGLAALLLLVPACASTESPRPPTIDDPIAYLVQARCPDGQLKVAEPACPARPQRAEDPMMVSRRDWPAPTGYMAQDAVIGPDGPETLWDFTPFGPFDARKGDGGEVYVVDGASVRISITQDGGTPYLQGFYGAGCGGTGWTAFRTDAPTGAWASLVARLSDGRVPGPCAAWSRALTRYRLESVTAPWIILGRRAEVTLPTIISEHYDRGSLAAARNMERSFFARGVGRIIWEAWTRGAPASADTGIRCPGTAWSTPPAPGWALSDCRYATNLVAADGAMSGARFGWPPKVSPMP
jgi:hypothetical protein